MTDNTSPKTIEMDETTFADVLPRLDAIDADDVIMGGANYDDATSRVLGVIEAMEKDSTLAQRIRRLPLDIFDHTHLDDLLLLTHTVMHCNQHATTADATASDALVPAHLVSKGDEIRSRAMALLSYYLGDHPTYGPDLADIRSGTGHLDLGMDLRRLATIIKDNRALLEHDAKHYRATDTADAFKTAIAISAAYNAQPTTIWADRTRRAFTLLDESYGEVRTAALYVFRDAPAKAGVFVTLRTGGRPRGSGKVAKGGAEPVVSVATGTTPPTT